jgi:hypothetical protein
VKSNPNLVWMFLSGNVDALVRLETERGKSNSGVAAAVVVPAAVSGNKRKRC